MRLFKNLCSGIGLLSIIAGICYSIGWAFYSLGKVGDTALAFGLSAFINYLR